MIADMISMMSAHGVRVEIVPPLKPTIKCSGLSEVLRTCRLHRHDLKLNSSKFTRCAFTPYHSGIVG
jgi:hypothetical protein